MDVFTKNKVVPKLRFQNFKEKYSSVKISEVAVINPKHHHLPDNFVYIDLECVKKGVLLKENIINKSSAPSRAQRVLENGDILYQSVRPYQKNNYLFNLKGNYVASTGYLQVKTHINNIYLYQYFHNNKFVNKVLKMCTGANYPTINSSDFGNILINLPSLPEQQKIAEFLSSVDKKIQLLEKKKEQLELYKKGVMQKIFSREIRFKDDNGNSYPDWEKIKLGEGIEQKSIRNKDNSVELVLSVSNKKGFISQQDQFDGYQVASKNVTNYKLVSKGEYAYNPSRINVGSIARLDDFERGIVSPMYVIFKLRNNLNPIFFDALYSSHRFKYLIKTGCSGSVRDSLNFDEMEKFDIELPYIEEQKKIANFLSAIDNKIDTTSTQIDKTKEFKKGLLQQMFV